MTITTDETTGCANCGRPIRLHKPSHNLDKSPCWVHVGSDLHMCSPDDTDDPEAMAAPDAAKGGAL